MGRRLTGFSDRELEEQLEIAQRVNYRLSELEAELDWSLDQLIQSRELKSIRRSQHYAERLVEALQLVGSSDRPLREKIAPESFRAQRAQGEKIPLSRHADISVLVRETVAEVNSLCNAIWPALGVASPAGRAVENLMHAVQVQRAFMVDLVRAQHPDCRTARSIYYPPEG